MSMFLKPRWHVPVQNLVKYPRGPGWAGNKPIPYFQQLIMQKLKYSRTQMPGAGEFSEQMSGLSRGMVRVGTE